MRVSLLFSEATMWRAIDAGDDHFAAVQLLGGEVSADRRRVVRAEDCVDLVKAKSGEPASPRDRRHARPCRPGRPTGF